MVAAKLASVIVSSGILCIMRNLKNSIFLFISIVTLIDKHDAAEFKTKNNPIVLLTLQEIKAYDLNPRFCPKLDSKPLGTKPQPKEIGQSGHTASKIIGGGKAYQSMFPWHALLVIDDLWLCSGSLISTEWILTAAHCVFGATSVVTWMGGVDRTSDTEIGEASYNSAQITIHNKYNDPFLNHDIALIKLAKSVTTNVYVNLIRLPSIYLANKVLNNVPASVSGYGKTGATNSVLNYVDVKLIKNSKCVNYYGPEEIQAEIICGFPYVENVPCGADSGSALVAKEIDGFYTQFGVMSFGEELSCNKFPLGFTRVTSYLGWISSVADIKIRSL